MLGIIMAGGQGSRLMPLTATRPKPMVELLGRPVIDYVKDAMVNAGVVDLVVTTGYRGEQLLHHVESWSAKTDSGSISASVNISIDISTNIGISISINNKTTTTSTPTTTATPT